MPSPRDYLSFKRTYFPFGRHARHQIKNELQTRYGNMPEACFNYVNSTGERLINKGIGLLTYNALLIALYTIPIARAEQLSLSAKIGVFLSAVSALLIMCFALLVQWPRPHRIDDASRESMDYVDEVANRTIAINVAVGLSMLATGLAYWRLCF